MLFDFRAPFAVPTIMAGIDLSLMTALELGRRGHYWFTPATRNNLRRDQDGRYRDLHHYSNYGRGMIMAIDRIRQSAAHR
ncbi:hypothetical protein [Rhizobium esperanzae]|nr:hypothetical protein [Rhizobium esperanzae]